MTTRETEEAKPLCQQGRCSGKASMGCTSSRVASVAAARPDAIQRTAAHTQSHTHTNTGASSHGNPAASRGPLAANAKNGLLASHSLSPSGGSTAHPTAPSPSTKQTSLWVLTSVMTGIGSSNAAQRMQAWASWRPLVRDPETLQRTLAREGHDRFASVVVSVLRMPDTPPFLTHHLTQCVAADDRLLFSFARTALGFEYLRVGVGRCTGEALDDVLDLLFRAYTFVATDAGAKTAVGAPVALCQPELVKQLWDSLLAAARSALAATPVRAAALRVMTAIVTANVGGMLETVLASGSLDCMLVILGSCSRSLDGAYDKSDASGERRLLASAVLFLLTFLGACGGKGASALLRANPWLSLADVLASCARRGERTTDREDTVTTLQHVLVPNIPVLLGVMEVAFVLLEHAAALATDPSTVATSTTNPPVQAGPPPHNETQDEEAAGSPLAALHQMNVFKIPSLLLQIINAQYAAADGADLSSSMSKRDLDAVHCCIDYAVTTLQGVLTLWEAVLGDDLTSTAASSSAATEVTRFSPVASPARSAIASAGDAAVSAVSSIHARLAAHRAAAYSQQKYLTLWRADHHVAPAQQMWPSPRVPGSFRPDTDGVEATLHALQSATRGDRHAAGMPLSQSAAPPQPPQTGTITPATSPLKPRAIMYSPATPSSSTPVAAASPIMSPTKKAALAMSSVYDTASRVSRAMTAVRLLSQSLQHRPSLRSMLAQGPIIDEHLVSLFLATDAHYNAARRFIARLLWKLAHERAAASAARFRRAHAVWRRVHGRQLDEATRKLLYVADDLAVDPLDVAENAETWAKRFHEHPRMLSPSSSPRRTETAPEVQARLRAALDELPHAVVKQLTGVDMLQGPSRDDLSASLHIFTRLHTAGYYDADPPGIDSRRFTLDDPVVQYCTAAIACEAVCGVPPPDATVLEGFEPDDDGADDASGDASQDAEEHDWPSVALPADGIPGYMNLIRAYLSRISDAGPPAATSPFLCVHLTARDVYALSRLAAPQALEIVAAFAAFSFEALAGAGEDGHARSDAAESALPSGTRASTRSFAFPDQLWFEKQERTIDESVEPLLSPPYNETASGTPWQFPTDARDRIEPSQLLRLTRRCDVGKAFQDRLGVWRERFPAAFGVVSGALAAQTPAGHQGYWPEFHRAMNAVVVALVRARSPTRTATSAPGAPVSRPPSTAASPEMINPLHLLERQMHSVEAPAKLAE